MKDILTIFDPVVDEIIIETRCEYITKKNLADIASYISPSKIIVAIGQESTDDEINSRANNKGHTKKQFTRAVKLLQEYGLDSAKIESGTPKINKI